MPLRRRSALSGCLPFAFAAAALLAAGAAHASPDARTLAEIDQLLGNIANSNCTFIRGGQEYSGEQARKHLESKLSFAGANIDSTEQFIDKIASVSSTTGEAYYIRCGKTETLARTWLNAQLKVVRRRR